MRKQAVWPIQTVNFSRHLLWWTAGRRELELGLGPQYQTGKTHWLPGTPLQTDVCEPTWAARANYKGFAREVRQSSWQEEPLIRTNKRFKRILEGILFQKILVLYSFWWKQNKTKAYLSTLEKLFIVYPLPIGEITFPQERCLFLWCFICTESSPSSLIPVTNLLLFWDSVRASHLVTPGLPWVTLHNGAALHLHYCPCRLFGKVLAFQPSRWSFCRKKSRPL